MAPAMLPPWQPLLVAVAFTGHASALAAVAGGGGAVNKLLLREAHQLGRSELPSFLSAAVRSHEAVRLPTLPRIVTRRRFTAARQADLEGIAHAPRKRVGRSRRLASHVDGPRCHVDGSARLAPTFCLCRSLAAGPQGRLTAAMSLVQP